MICFTIKLKGFEATYNTNPTMLSIVSRTALQCPIENILLLKQIQKYSRSKRLGYKTSKSEKGGEGDERESFPASEGERGAEKSKTRYYEDDDDGDGGADDGHDAAAAGECVEDDGERVVDEHVAQQDGAEQEVAHATDRHDGLKEKQEEEKNYDEKKNITRKK